MRFTFAVGALVAVAWAMPVHAQQLDSRWAPWIGCWQLAGESVRVCVARPADGAGVTLSTHVENAAERGQAPKPVLEQTLVADGVQHPIVEAECRGWQQAEWSRTGERLFARAELTCAGGSVRRVSGFSTITSSGIWIDIQGIEIAGRENIRVRRYRRTGDRAGGAAAVARLTALAPRLGSTPFTVDDVKEASARVSPRVMEAALVETNAGFDLSSRVLVDLDAAGVPDNVIDTMVALSYPRHFVVDRPGGGGASAAFLDPYFDNTSFGAWPFPYYGNYWSGYGYDVYSPYFYSPFGYAYWGSYGGYFPYGSYVSGPGFVNIDVSDNADGGGRVVNGVGYTRIRTRADVEAQASGSRRSDSTGSSDTSSTSGVSSTSSSGGSAGVSSSGFSGGSSSTDTGRTAEPR